MAVLGLASSCQAGLLAEIAKLGTNLLTATNGQTSASTAVYAHIKGWSTIIPAEAWAGGLAAAILIGALAGLLPAIRAARLSPTQALWSL